MNKKLIISLILFILLLLLSSTRISWVHSKSAGFPKPTHKPFPTIRVMPSVKKVDLSKKLANNQVSLQSGSELTVWVDASFSGTSNGSESAPYKDIFTAVSIPSVNSLLVNIKPGTYDETSHDLLGAATAKIIEFTGITSEKPVIKTEFISCLGNILTFNNIKIISEITAVSCKDSNGIILRIENTDITAGRYVVDLGLGALININDSNFISYDKSLNLSDQANVEIKNSQLKAGISTKENPLLVLEKVKVQSSITTGNGSLIKVTDSVINDSITTLNNSVINANMVTLGNNLEMDESANVELIDSKINGSVKTGDFALLDLDKTDVFSLVGKNYANILYKNGTITEGVNVDHSGLALIEKAIIYGSISMMDGANVQILDSQINNSVTLGDSIIFISDNSEIKGPVNTQNSSNINFKSSLIRADVELGDWSLVLADDSSFSGNFQTANNSIVGILASKLKQMSLGNESILISEKSTFKCGSNWQNAVTTGERSNIWIQNTIINDCQKAVATLKESILYINLSTIVNTSSEAISYNGNLPLNQDSDGTILESLHIENSIFSGINGHIVNLFNHDPNQNPKPKAKIYYNDLYQTQGLSGGVSDFCDNCQPNYNFDPLFKNPQADDFHLLPNSPAIDVGNPESDYSQEPLPNGGRVDLGAYGNTPEATSGTVPTIIPPTQTPLVDLSIKEIKPIQVVENVDINNDGKIDLVQDKPAVVRVAVKIYNPIALSNDDLITLRLFFQGVQYEKSLTKQQLLTQNSLVDFFLSPSHSGDYTMTVRIDPDRAINESDESNNSYTNQISVKETKGLEVVFLPVNCYGTATKFSNTATKSEEFLRTLYPIAPSKLTPRQFENSIDCVDILNPKLAYPIESINLWRLGKKLDGHATHVVGIATQVWGNSRISGADGATFCGFPAVFVLEGSPDAIPHEIGHSYQLNHPDEHGCLLGPKGGPVLTEGYWVKDDTVIKLENAESIMSIFSGSLGDLWITSNDYHYLFQQFRKNTNDPEILLISGLLYTDGRVEQVSFDWLVSGVVDESYLGDYSIKLNDIAGNEVFNMRFDVQFSILMDQPMDTDVVPFGFAIPYVEEAMEVEIQKNGQVLAGISIPTQLLRDAIKSIPDNGFIKNPKERRNALLNKIDALDRQLAKNDLTGVRERLKNDIRKHLVEWLVDDYPTQTPLQYTKTAILELVDELLQRFGG